MATAYQNLSSYDSKKVPSGKDMNIGIVVAEWNYDITSALCAGAIETLVKHGVEEKNITVRYVPGSFELISGCKTMAENIDADAIIAIGTVVQGDTPHFTYVCQGVTYGIAELNLSFDIPFIFSVLTTDTMQQAIDRAGGIHGNKGDEAAITALKMIAFRRNLEN